MKYCKECGAENLDNAAYCKNCGKELSVINNAQNQVKPKKEGLGVASMVIGIISLVFAFIFNVIIIPLAVIGLILGIVNKASKGKKFSGIILNSLAIVVAIVVAVIITLLIGTAVSNIDESKLNNFLNKLYNELDYSTSENYVEGTWNCKDFDGSGESDDYTITLQLNSDNTFKYGKYGDLNNNHAGGTYTYEDEKEKNEKVTNGYKYFTVKFTGDENDYVVNGVNQNRQFTSELEMGITSNATKKESIIIFPSTYNMYYCYRK